MDWLYKRDRTGRGGLRRHPLGTLCSENAKLLLLSRRVFMLLPHFVGPKLNTALILRHLKIVTLLCMLFVIFINAVID